MNPQLPLTERAQRCKHPVAQELFKIMSTKQTNLSFAADVTEQNRLLELADETGPHICVLKTHVDILSDFTPDFPSKITALARKHNFLIFEDRKFADIGNTTQLQYAGGVFRIADWAHISNAHIVAGPGTIQALRETGLAKQRALLLLAEMSSAGTMATGAYTERAVEMAEEYDDFVIGFIATRRLSSRPNFIHFTPGVRFQSGGDALGQQYLTPAGAIQERGSDVIIVGRAILNAQEPWREAVRYREAAWGLFVDRFS